MGFELFVAFLLRKIPILYLLCNFFLQFLLLSAAHCSASPTTQGLKKEKEQREERNLVDPASSHMLVSKIKPCMSQYKFIHGETAKGSLKQL